MHVLRGGIYINQDCITMEHVGISFQKKMALDDVNIRGIGGRNLWFFRAQRSRKNNDDQIIECTASPGLRSDLCHGNGTV